MKKTIITSCFLLFSTSVFGSNCSDFKNDKNKLLCSELSKKNVDQEFIKKYLTQQKSRYRDTKTLKLIAPKEIKSHSNNEKRANNSLINSIDAASKHLQKYSKVYDYVEKKFNVDREIIAGILLKETRLGTYEPQYDAYITLNTVFQETTPDTKRNKWLYNLSKKNLVYLGEYCFSKKIPANECNFKSSYIGAIGFPQFMPMNLYLARSYTNSVPNLNKIEDAIVSVANYFNKIATYNKLINWNKVGDIKNIEKDWYDFEHKYEKSSFASKKGKKCFSCDKPELNEMSKYIKKILRYNNSSNYAVGVFRIAWELHNIRTKK